MPASRKLQLDTGLGYHLLEWDGGGDHTILLIHGFLDHAWGWQPMVEAGLAGGLHIVAPDMRGHGDSDWIGAGGYYHFPDYLADLHDLVEKLARPRLSLVGHSMGGSIAAYYAGAFPDRVHRLALLEGLGPPETSTSMPERIVTWLAAWKRVRERTPKSYASLDEAAARLAAHDPLVLPAEALRLAERGTAPALGNRVRFKHDPLHATPGPYGFSLDVARQFWTRICCPTLLVYGADSRLRHAPPEESRRGAFFANARTVTLPNAGHMLQRHQPTALAHLLRDFLTA